MLPYRVEKTRNRHSRAVLRDDVIVIRLARNLSAREERTHVEYLLGRMKALAERERLRPRIDPFRELLDGKDEIALELSTGGRHRFALRPGPKTRARRTADGWTVDVGPGTGRRELHRFLWRLLSESARAEAEAYVRAVNDETLRFGFGRVMLRRMTSQWGSCSPDGRIVLNTALLALPLPLLRYVVIHELAHRRYRGHGPRFWSLVESVCPEAGRIRKELRAHRVSSL